MTPGGTSVPGQLDRRQPAIVPRCRHRQRRMLALSLGIPGRQSVTLTSTCNVTSQWIANGTNMPEQQSMPERG